MAKHKMNLHSRNQKNKSKIFSTRTVKEVIGSLEKGCEIFCFTKGQYFLIDIIAYILNQIGSADVDVLTWAIGNETIDKLIYLKNINKIKNMRIIADYSYKTMHPEYCQKLREIFGDDSIRVTKNHAKIMIIRNSGWNLSIRSSMNLNINRRLEYFEISDDIDLADYFTSFFDDWFKTKSTGESFEYPTKYHTDELKKFRKKDIDMNFNFDTDLNFDPFTEF